MIRHVPHRIPDRLIDCTHVPPYSSVRHDLAAVVQLVTVKADDWRKRSGKVMSQARPQLEVVRQLFHEGRELGFEERGEAPGYE